MFGSTRNRERRRYYLLAGMGGSAARRKHKLMMQWAIITGLLVSAALALAIYYINLHWK